nr:hypothetical protein [Limnohabitans sp. Jir72]
MPFDQIQHHLHVLIMAPSDLFFSHAPQLSPQFFVGPVRQQTFQGISLLFEQDAALVSPLWTAGVTVVFDIFLQTLKPLFGPLPKGPVLEFQVCSLQTLVPIPELLQCCADMRLGDFLRQCVACPQTVLLQQLQQSRPLVGTHIGVTLVPCGQGVFQSHIQIAQLSSELPQIPKSGLAALRQLRQQGFVKLQQAFLTAPCHSGLVQALCLSGVRPGLEKVAGVLQRDTQKMFQMPPGQASALAGQILSG